MLISWCQKKIFFSDLKLKNTSSQLQYWAVWLIIIKPVKQNENWKSASKKNIQSGHDPTKKHSETSLMAKVPSKINNFEGLEKVCHTFSQIFLWKRHDMPHQTSTENDSQKKSLLIEYGRARFVTHIVTHHTWPSHKRSNPYPQPPLFSKHFLIFIFFQIWWFPSWRLFSVGDSIARFERFD